MSSPWLAQVLSRLSRKSACRPRPCPWPDVGRLLATRLRIEQLEDRIAPAVFTVTNTADSGAGSLRQAILDANAAAGVDTITFDIGDGGAQSIAPLSSLPAVTEAVVLDAATQRGYAGAPLIELRGDSAGAGVNGLTVTAGGVTIRGFAINRFAGSGVQITGAAATGNVVEGNYIGTNPTGTAALGNGFYGVLIEGGATNNTIGGASAAARNVISGNAGIGVLIAGAGTNANSIQGNYVGTNAAGTAAVPNATWGVIVLNGANNRIGGDSTAGLGNVISGNSQGGVAVFGTGASGNRLHGNVIGLNAAGTAALGNAFSGVYTGTGSGFGISGYSTAGSATNTLVGGPAAGLGNVISANGGFGVWVSGSGATGALIQGNLIGTNAAGTAALGNSSIGVVINAGAQSNVVGTDGDGVNDAAERNVISGNLGSGILITGSTTTLNAVAGNYVGLTAAGTAALANNGFGIDLTLGAGNNRIGTDANGLADAAERNVISGNANSGIRVADVGTAGNVIAGNYIGTDWTGTAAVGNGSNGVQISNGSNTTVGGSSAAARNVISGNNANGVLVELAGATGNVIAGNHIGTNAAGTAAVANSQRGVLVLSGAKHTRIGTDGDGVGDLAERNVISGNASENVWINGVGTDDTVIAGNYIGLNAAGTAAITNGAGAGLAVFGGPKRTRIGTNADGVGDDLERNVISGNKAEGVLIGGAGTEQTVVAGNYIGTNAAGTAAVPNLAIAGVYIRTGAANNRIGTNGDGVNDAAERNVISGNAGPGVQIVNAGTNNNVVAGNYIGTDWTGTVALGNGSHGVAVAGGAQDTRIGTDGSNDAFNAAERNVIAGNTGNGIGVSGAGTNRTVIAGNYLGIDATGTVKLQNSHGIGVTGGADDTRIGTDGNGVADATERNVISGNNFEGIVVASATTDRTVIAGNYIGTDWTGTAAIPNGNQGIAVRFGAQDTRIGTDGNGVGDAAERNVISGNTNWGIVIQTPQWDGTLPDEGVQAERTIVAGNYIGTDWTGTAALGNGSGGVIVQLGARNTRIGTDGNGVADAAERNFISGNLRHGVFISGGETTGTVIAGNYIGTDSTGTTDLGNAMDGVHVTAAPGVRIGGTAPGAGNVISGNDLDGIELTGGATGALIQGNLIGTDWTGTVALGNASAGVLISAGAQFNIVGTDGNGVNDAAERNVSSGNGWDGVAITGVGTNFNVVAGNYLGTNAAGTAAIQNLFAGVSIHNGAQFNRIGTDGNGVSDALERNVASGNRYEGIWIGDAGTANNVVAGNYVGTNAAGTGPLPNGAGIVVYISAGNRIGTNGDGVNDAAERNVVSGNTANGILVSGTGATGNVVAGNYIGLDAAGTGGVGNGGAGVVLIGGASSNMIGTAGGRNVISGNVWVGVWVADAGTNNNVIAGNYIGTNAAGTAALGNSHGVGVSGGAADTRIGTDGNGVNDAAERNVISGNTHEGVLVVGVGTDRTVIAGNYIGTNAAGTAALGNSTGISVRYGAQDTRIGTDGSNDAFNSNERNVVSGNTWVGFWIQTPEWDGTPTPGGEKTSRTVIAGNYIGTNAAGTAAVGNASNGINILSGAISTRVGTDGNGVADADERNVIAGNGWDGIGIWGAGTSNTLVAGNYLGVNVLGSALANGASGIAVGDSASNTVIGGGSWVDPATGRLRGMGNVISGNPASGVYLDHVAGALVQGNFIGTDPTGTIAVPNDPLANWGHGVAVVGGSAGVVIGGASSVDAFGRLTGLGNLISSNGLAGVFVGKYDWNSGELNQGTLIQGNFIGTDVTGTMALGNIGDGVLLGPTSANTTVGGTANGTRNVVSGNTGSGITVAGATGTVVAGNYVGTNRTGTAAVGNVTGVLIQSGATTSIVGGTAAGAANLIAFNTGRGLVIQGAGTAGNTASRNSVFANAGGNITVLGGANPTAVTPDLRAVLTGATTRVIGTLAGAPFASYRLELYASSPTTAEARQFLAEAVVTASAAGAIPLDVVLPFATPAGGGFTLLATRLDTGETGALSKSTRGTLVVVDGVPQAAVPEGAPLTFATRATDPGPGQSVRYDWKVTRGGQTVATGDEAVFSFTPDDDGTYTLSLVVRTTTGLTGMVPSTIIAVFNTAPVVEFTSFPESAPPGAPFDVLARVTDLGTADTFTYQWRVWRDGVLVTAPAPANPLQFVYTPTANGLYEVELTVHDDEGLAGSRKVAVVVQGQVPEAQIEIQSEGREGATVHARAALSAVLAQDTLTFEWTVTKNGVPYTSATGVGRPNFEFVPDDDGLYVVGLRLSTPFASYTSPSRAIAIQNVIPEGRIAYDYDADGIPDAGPPPPFRAGTAIPFLADVRDVGSADTHVFHWSIRDAGTGQVVRQAVGRTLTFNPPAGGTYIVSLTVEDDDGGRSEVSAAIEVSAPARDVHIHLPAVTPKEGDLVALTATITPVPGDVGFHYRWEVRKDGEVVASADSGSFTTTPLGITFTPADDGRYEVRLSVRGEDGSTGDGVRYLDVLNVLPTVTIGAVPESVPEGATVVVAAAAFDPGARDTLTYTWTVSLGGAVVATAVGPSLTFTPADDGDYLLRVEVRDDDQPTLFGFDEAVLHVYNVAPTVVIRTATDPNGAPVFPPDEAGFQFHLTSGAFDPGADALLYAWSVVRIDTAGAAHPLPPALMSPSDRVTFSFSPDGQPGTYVVSLTVDDSDGGVTTQVTRIIVGTDGDDVLTVTPDDLVGGATSVLVIAGGGNDLIDASGVNFQVVLEGGDGDDTILGGTGSDLILGGAGTDLLIGGTGDDTLVTQHGDDTVIGGDGHDTYIIVPGSDTTLVESDDGGIDTINFAFAERAVIFDLTAAGVFQTVDAAGNRILFIGSFEAVEGSAFNDRLTAASGTSLFGGEGDDHLIVGVATAGVTVFGGTGADTIEVLGGSDVTVFGGDGDDLIRLAEGAANATVFGGAGADSVEAAAAAGVTVFGGDGDDRIVLTATAGVTVFGGSGADVILVTGGSGIAVFGGDAEGLLTPEFDLITVFGGSGDDRIEIRDATDVTVFGGDGADAISILSGSVITVFGGEGDDAIVVSTPDGLVTVFGGAGHDAITVSAGDGITVFGGEGNDTLSVLDKAGRDITVFGGAGDDTIAIGAGSAVTVFGGEGADVVAVTGGSDVTVFGEGGDDVLSILGGTGVTAFGGDGDDQILIADGGAVTVFGGEGDDTIVVQGGTAITVFGGDGADVIAVTGGADVTVFGGEGNDTIVLRGAGVNITVFGGEGDDRIDAAAPGALGVTIFGGEGNDEITVSAGDGITVFGGEGDDVIAITGKAGRDITVFGGSGDDTIAVSGGTAVTVFGGDGADAIAVTGGADVTVFGGEGNDTLTISGGTAVTVFGEGGDDTLIVSAGNGVTVFGGEGNDTLIVQGEAGRDITVFGGDGDDTIAVSGGTAVTVFGGDGADAIAVTGGADVTVFGGEGNDTLTISGGTGITVFGGSGDDTIAVSGGTAVTVFGGDGADAIAVTGGADVTVFGGEGNDTLTISGGTGITVFGGSGDDTIAVSAGDGVTVFGGEGNDTLTVSDQAGRDITVFGGDGDDTILIAAGHAVTVFGGAGDDRVTITAAAGSDITVLGGEGNDVVVVEAGTNVTVLGEAGDDTLTVSQGGGRIVNLFGGAGADAITVAAGSHITVYGGSGDDVIRVEADAGDDITVFGGSGDDVLVVTAGTRVTLLGERGNDDLTAAGVSHVNLFGGAGNDRLHGTGGVEISLYGDDGDDTYLVTADALRETLVRVKEIQTLGAGHQPGEKGATGTDHLDRPSFGSETLDLSSFHAITIDLNILGTDLDLLAGWQVLADAAGRIAVIVLHGFFENVIGTAGNDRIVGNHLANRLVGLGGNDTLIGLDGDDTLEGGAGDDVLDGGAGNDTYVFAGTGLGSDLVIEADDRDSDTLDFSGLANPVAVYLGSTAPQAWADVTVTLSHGRGLENVIGTAHSDSLTGNDRDNVLEGGPGDDVLIGGAGADTYRFAGEGLGTDTIIETGDDADTLDFSRLLGGIVVDLTSPAPQGSAEAATFVVLGDPSRFENVIGTAFPDVIKGNGADNVLIGGGGRDHLDGRDGNDTLRGGSGQVIYLDFTSATDPWDWQYDPDQREAIRDNLARDFAPFGYVVTLTAPATGPYLTVVFNDDQPGGRSEGIDFRNTTLGGRATVNVNDLLDDLAASLAAAGVPQADIEANWARYVADLSAHIAGHEAGHSFGLRHGDSYGPIGTGVNTAAQSLRYLPTLSLSAAGATETGWHLMSSPASVGTSLADAARDTFLGLREAVKLAHADTGTTVRESAPGYNAHGTFATAIDLGRFHGLSVPNTLRRADDPFFGRSLSVASVAVIGSIVRPANATPADRSEDDVYSFTAYPGEWFHFEVYSYALGLANPIDSVLLIYDAAGNLLAWNDDEFETPDAIILDWTPAVAGTYYLVVDTYTPDGVRDFDTGGYELFAYRVAEGPDLGLGDTIVTGAGLNTVYTSSGRDTVKLSAGTHATLVSFSFTAPLIENTAGATFVAYDAGGEPIELPVKTVNAPPQLDPIVLPPGLAEGQTVTFTAVGHDPDATDLLTYTIEPTTPGGALPPGLTIDAVSGRITWSLLNNGTYSFRVVATDTSGERATQDVTAVVANVGPTAVLTGPGQIPEGSTAAFTVAASDVGVLDVLSYTWTVDGVLQVGQTGASFTLVPTANRPYVVAVTVADGDGESVTVSRTVTVVNLAPTAAIAVGPPAPVEGDTITLTGTAADAGGPSAIAGLAWTVHFRKREADAPVLVAGATGSASLAFTAADDGFYDVTFEVTDRDGAKATATRVVYVSNLAPVVAPLADLTLGAAQPAQFTATATDVAADLPLTYLWRVTGPAGPLPGGSAATFSFLPPEAGTYTVLLKVTDRDGASVDRLATVVVTRAPTATFAQFGTADEGSTATVAFTDPHDDPADLAAGLRYSFDLDNDGVYEIVDSTSPFASRVFNDNGTYTVRGKVTDKDGAFTVYTATVTVRNIAPTATLTHTGPADEGSPVTIRLIDPFDPSPADVTAGLRYSFALTPEGLAADYAAAGTAAARTFTFLDNGTYTVYARVFDKDGGFTQYETTVRIDNAAPVVGPITAPTTPVAAGTAVAVSVSFTDAGVADTHTYRWAWGDGTWTDGAVGPGGGGTITASHVYARAGVYVVTVTVRDNDGAEHGSSFRYVVVYDTEAGAVNGSGWFNSPAGAYVPDPALTGKAHFGFVSRYGNGAIVPTGTASFRLGGFDFRSTGYNWMVISGARGMVTGTGTVNGVAGYGFLVSGLDGRAAGGGGDLLRFKIWNLATGAVIYDNQPGAADDAVPTMPIGAGNIVIYGGNGLAAAPAAGTAGTAVVTASDLAPLVAEALARWRAAGVATDAVAGLPVWVADLPGDMLGLATPGGIWIDIDAAGRGWFVDPTPADDSEFWLDGDQGEQGRIDLLTVLIHEFGHLLGYDHEEEGVMGELIGPGRRLLPHHDHPAGHEDEPEAPLAGPAVTAEPNPAAPTAAGTPAAAVPPAGRPPAPAPARNVSWPAAVLPQTVPADPAPTAKAPAGPRVAVGGWAEALPPTTPVPPPPHDKPASRPAADDGETADSGHGELHPPAGHRRDAYGQAEGWTDWPAGWWGVPVDPLDPESDLWPGRPD